jgi:ubiquinone/menaquinone biosynthesis C-methylase UbiE
MTSYSLWNRYMHCYDALTQVESYNRNIDDIASMVMPCHGARILDAGSGTGTLSMLLEERGADVTSLDFSEEALRQHLKKAPAAKVMRASLEDPLVFDEGSFDFVCCASVLFALSYSGCHNAVREFFRVLRPNGRLIVSVAAPAKKNGALLARHLRKMVSRSVPVRQRMSTLLDMPRVARVMYYNYRLQKLPDWQGYHRFSEQELNELLVDAGFNDISIGRTYSGSFFLAVATKKL